jgi:phosphoribosylformylglycinamidine cyclo-ligase
MNPHTYTAAGVDLQAARDIKQRIRAIAAPTHGPEVLSGIGAFGGAYQLSSYQEPVLVSSADGVGTKLKLASMMKRFDTAGADLVNACVNDIIVCGAKPLFFLDYIAVGELVPATVEGLLEGMARACLEVECALIGGETAQMPGVYGEGDFDLAGFVVGVVEKSRILDGTTIHEGDVLLGIPSNGLHTNGYSLVRHIWGLDGDPSPLREYHPELGKTLGEALLTPHRSYYQMVRPVFSLLKAAAHITGGGLIENVPRVLPDGLAARFDTSTWSLPPIFSILQEQSEVSREEMYRVFNMGLGMVLVSDASRVGEIIALAPEARVVGEVVPSTDETRVVL